MAHVSPKRPFHILLAEDDENDVFIIRVALADTMNLQLSHVRDGLEAIEYLLGHGPFGNREKFPEPNLLLLDIKMPRMGGFEFLKWRHEHAEFRRLPVMITSSSNLQSDIDRAYELGANAYMVKPIGLERIRHVFRVSAEFWTAISEWPMPVGKTG